MSIADFTPNDCNFWLIGMPKININIRYPSEHYPGIFNKYNDRSKEK